MVEIIRIELNLRRNGEVIPAVDLCPTRQPRNQAMNPLLGPKRDQIILVKKGWPRPDKADVSLPDIVELREFIQA